MTYIPLIASEIAPHRWLSPVRCETLILPEPKDPVNGTDQLESIVPVPVVRRIVNPRLSLLMVSVNVRLLAGTASGRMVTGMSMYVVSAGIVAVPDTAV
jgi:hypothetical protein